MHGQRARTRSRFTPGGRSAFLCSGSLTSLALACALFILCAQASPCLARTDQDVLVLLLRRLPSDAIHTEAMVRIKSELLANGFQVAVVDSEGADDASDPRAFMERAGKAPVPSATIGIFGDLQQGVADLWVVDRLTKKRVIRHMEVQASSDRPISEVLAIRAQELLRARMVEMTVDENRPEPAAAAQPLIHDGAASAPASPASPFAPWSVGLELGGAAFGARGGLGTMVAPAARLRLALGEYSWVRLTALGMGTRPTVGARVGPDVATARVGQDLLLAEFAAWLRPRRLVRPTFSVGLCGVRIAVDGTASAPFQGEHNVRWYAGGDLGIGVALRWLAHWEAQLEVHALFLAPHPSIRFFDMEAAQVTQPTVLAILTLAGGG